VLPQALAMVVPSIMNNFISTFKDTSLVTIVSLYELTGAMKLALNSDANWRPFKIEGYFFIAADLLCVLLLHVALQPSGSKSRSTKARRAELNIGPAELSNTTATTGNTMSEPIITFDKVNKWYGNNFHVLRDIDLSVAKGERIVICGPSGSGKSTLIRCINRLEEHQQGRLIVDGVELTDDVKAIDQVRKKWAWCSSSSTCSRT
jgi:ABC-type multidrug transport system fused ATPase/permease subunit